MAEKITQKQMFTLIAEKCADDEKIVEFCNLKIAQLDKRKATPRKPNPEVQERRDAIMNHLAGVGAQTTKEIADALGFTSPQVSGALRGLVNAGAVKVVEPEKKSQPKRYELADATSGNASDPAEEF